MSAPGQAVCKTKNGTWIKLGTVIAGVGILLTFVIAGLVRHFEATNLIATNVTGIKTNKEQIAVCKSDLKEVGGKIEKVLVNQADMAATLRGIERRLPP